MLKLSTLSKYVFPDGIKILQSVPHTPQQNGRTECFMHTCMDKAQALHLDACFPESWWEFAVEHAVETLTPRYTRKVQVAGAPGFADKAL